VEATSADGEYPVAAIEPSAEEFFASETGVCVYVNVDGRAFRVQFASLDDAPTARGIGTVGVEEAIAAASSARERYRAKLEPLFLQIAQELAERQR
jgi:hypothetical protein